MKIHSLQKYLWGVYCMKFLFPFAFFSIFVVVNVWINICQNNLFLFQTIQYTRPFSHSKEYNLFFEGQNFWFLGFLNINRNIEVKRIVGASSNVLGRNQSFGGVSQNRNSIVEGLILDLKGLCEKVGSGLKCKFAQSMHR